MVVVMISQIRTMGTFSFFFKGFIFYLFLERGEEREKERERNINQLPLTQTQLGTWCTTQAWALTGIKLVTIQFVGWHSVHWATPAMAMRTFLC